MQSSRSVIKMSSKSGRVITYFGYHESFDFASVRDMRSNAEIHHGSTAVNSSGTTIWNFRLD